LYFSALFDLAQGPKTTNKERGTKNDKQALRALPMKIERFEDIEAWQIARELTREVYAAAQVGPFAKDYGLRDQITRVGSLEQGAWSMEFGA
jgi:hypothetical protein